MGNSATGGWIGVDLDGTLAEYHGWEVGKGQIGPPVRPMQERVMHWLAQGADVRIMTARVSDPDPVRRAQQVQLINNWCREHIGQELPITNTKDYGMLALWDDRCVQVQANTGHTINCLTRSALEAAVWALTHPLSQAGGEECALRRAALDKCEAVLKLEW